jgi:5'-deoxynucleotidase YfbR-like HD superfamily hydrolase
MAILALMFWPEPDAVLLAQCVTHDLGEYKTGDIPWGAPNKDHEAEDIARGEMGMCFNPPDPRLKFLDSLDAYLWMQHHAPDCATSKDWQDQRIKIIDQARELGVSLTSHNIHLWR